MAVTPTHLTTGSSTTNASSYTTASITPGANWLVLVGVLVSVNSSPTPAISVSGCGLTWVQVDQTVAGARTIHVFRAMGASPTTGALTISGTSLTSCLWSVVQFDGVDTSGTNGSGAIAQSFNDKSPNTNSISVAFPTTPTAGNGGFGFVGTAVQEVPTAGSGWTAGGATSQSAPTSGAIGEHAVSCPANVAASWTTSAAPFTIGVEVKAAGGAAPTTVTPGLASSTATANAPSLSATVTTAPGLASSNAQTFTPSVSTAVTATPGLASSTASALTPSVSTTVTVTPGVATSAPATFAPTVTTTVTVVPGLASSTATAFAPVVTLQGGPTTVVPGLASSTAVALAPAATTTVTTSPGLAASTAQAFAPAVTATITSTPGLASSAAAAAYAPVIANPGVDTYHPHEAVTAVLSASGGTAVLAGNGLGTATLAATDGTAVLVAAAGTAVLDASTGTAELEPAGVLALVNT